MKLLLCFALLFFAFATGVDAQMVSDSTVVASDTAAATPDNPFAPEIGADEIRERALDWFNFAQWLIVWLIGWGTKALGLTKDKRPVLHRFLPGIVFLLSFVGFGVGYGWDVVTLATSVVNIGMAIFTHTAVINPAEKTVSVLKDRIGKK